MCCSGFGGRERRVAWMWRSSREISDVTQRLRRCEVARASKYPNFAWHLSHNPYKLLVSYMPLARYELGAWKTSRTACTVHLRQAERVRNTAP